MVAATVNTTIPKHLRLKCSYKARVHDLQPQHIKERKTNCRRLYVHHCAGDKCKFVVALDKAYISLSSSVNVHVITSRNIDAKKTLSASAGKNSRRDS